MDGYRITFLSNIPPPLRSSITCVIIAVCYLIAARLSLLLALPGTNASPFWPPSGIALAAVMIFGYRMGPAILIGSFFANLLTLKAAGYDFTQYLPVSLATALGNMAECMVGAYLTRRMVGNNSPFETIKHYFSFVISGGLISTLVSPCIGVTSYSLVSGAWDSYMATWVTWWLGDATGVIITSPLLMLMPLNKWKKPSGINVLEIVLGSMLLALTCLLVFYFIPRFEYLIIPTLLLVTVRFGRIASAGSILFVSLFAMICTVSGETIIHQIFGQPLLYLQTFIGSVAITILAVAVLMHERDKSARDSIIAQKRFYDIIEFLPDATFAVDVQGRIIAWNRAMEALTGVPKSEVIDKGCDECDVPLFKDLRPLSLELIENVNNPPHHTTGSYYVRNDYTAYVERFYPHVRKYFSIAASLLVDGNGAINGAIESMRDISDRIAAERELKHWKDHLEDMVIKRSSELLVMNQQLKEEINRAKQTEEALIESEKKYRDLVESANSVILRWRPDGTIAFFNKFAQRFFGFTEEEILGRNVVGTIVPEKESSGRDLAILIEDIILHPKNYAYNENENITKSGERVWISWTNRPIFDESGSLVEILSVGNDITDRKKMEESLKQTLIDLSAEKERAESADRLKSMFLATMSHELRTPLNSIIGFTGILLQGLAGPLNDEQEKQLHIVRVNAQHLLSLINDILDISKIEAGQIELHLEEFDPAASLEKIIAAVRPSAEKKGLSFDITIGEGVGAVVSDRRRVEQILYNLLSNAIKFTDEGSVTISVQLLHDYPQPSSGFSSFISFKVTDTGIGIRPEDISEIFKPFRQIDSGLTRKGEGTGLGLAICRRLADILGGEITVESEWGQGSTFTFILPHKRSA